MLSSLVFTGPCLQIWKLERAAWGQRGPYARLGQYAINTAYAVSIISIIIMNSCPRLHFKISPKRFTMAPIKLFSAF